MQNRQHQIRNLTHPFVNKIDTIRCLSNMRVSIRTNRISAWWVRSGIPKLRWRQSSACSNLPRQHLHLLDIRGRRRGIKRTNLRLRLIPLLIRRNHRSAHHRNFVTAFGNLPRRVSLFKTQLLRFRVRKISVRRSIDFAVVFHAQHGADRVVHNVENGFAQLRLTKMHPSKQIRRNRH